MRRRSQLTLEVDRLASAMAATLGGEVRRTRRRRRLTQEALGSRIGLSHARIGEIERGEGATAPIRTWVALGLAIGRPLAVELSRSRDDPRDAGHLAVQELVLRLARDHGRERHFELPTRSTDPARSVDVGLIDDGYRALILVECLNRVVDLGEAVRQAARKEAEAEDLAVALAAGDRPYRVAWCWVMRDVAANRDLVRRYPEVLRARFAGSSVGWVRCLADSAEPPRDAGLIWADTSSGVLRPVRLG